MTTVLSRFPATSADCPSFPRKRESIPTRSLPNPREHGFIPPPYPSFPRMRESILSRTLPNPRKHDYIPPPYPSFPRKRESIRIRPPSHPQSRDSNPVSTQSQPRENESSPPPYPSFPRKREPIFDRGLSGLTKMGIFAARLYSSPRSLGLSFALCIVLTLLLPSTLAAADGTITGTVVNGTAGGDVPADVTVTLYFLRDGEIMEQRTQVTGSDGAYRFVDLPTDPVLSFVAVAAYERVPYNTEELHFSENTEIQAAPLTVYEASRDESVVSVVTNVLIIAPGEERSGMLSVLEVVRLNNRSDRTYLATGVAGGGQPMNILRFALPPDAQDLTMISGLSSDNVVQIDRGFGVFMPLLPGEREVAFGYQVPYSGSRLDLRKRTVYPTEQFAVLAAEEHALEFNTDQLEVNATPIGQRRYLVGTINALGARQEVSVQIAGLPTPSLQVRLERLYNRARDTQATLFILLGIVLIVPVLYAVYRMRGGLRRKAGDVPAGATAAPLTAETLLLEIAQLDDDYAAGAVTEAEYQRLRAAKKQQLMALHQEHDGSGNE